VRYEFRPLAAWPDPVTRDRQRGPFSAPWAKTLALLGRETEYLGAQIVVLQVDAPAGQIRNDGMLYARARVDFPGVRIAFNSVHGPLTYATDRYDHWQNNVRAVALGLEALRAVDRYGITKRGEQYRGWTGIAAEPAAMTPERAAEFIAEQSGRRWPARSILTDPDVLGQAYRAAARNHHPDAGGVAAEFDRLTKARDLISTGAAS
jgi:hypothetical protein